ncbi:MAG: hypothetical protein J6P73_00395 [Bacteroidales bacterium]|nr:hypothetical protein [Bacteroidales bacterium]
MKKGFLLTLFVVLTGLAAFAQDRPKWIYSKPTPANDTYLYVVESATGNTVIEARNSAIGEVFRSTAMRIGQPFDGATISSALQKGTDFSVISREYNIPINKVCEFSEKVPAGYTVYILCQVARAGNITVQWSEYSGCDRQYVDGMAVLKSALLPGLGQFHKGQNVKGACFLAGEVALVGGALFANYERHKYVNLIKTTNNANNKKVYTDRANMFGTVRTVAIGAAAAVYVWNVLDAVISKTNHQKMLSYGNPVYLTPVVTDESVALSMSINF